MPDFLYIPGDLRQQYLPFTIAGPGKKQVFSFKDRTKEGLPAFKQVSTFSRWLPQLIENDSSFQYSHGPEDRSSKVTLKQFLDEIPSLQIREFVPDAKLTQTFKWFSYFKKGFDTALKNVDGESLSFSQMKAAADEVMNNLAKTIKGLTSGMAELLHNVVRGLASLYEDRGFNVGGDDGYAVLFLPFILYYRLTTTHTNNVYELPYAINSEIMKSDGTYGWTNSRSDFGFLDTALDKASENSLVKMALGNTVRINTMPSFQPTGETHGETITINIDLINDTDTAAAANFLMCHTLFGNNRWLQYGFVQAGASLYDIKLPGANRYMMCAGQFSCKAKGAFRSPSDNVLNGILNGCKAKETRTFGDVIAGNNDLKTDMILSMAERRLNQQREKNASSLTTRATIDWGAQGNAAINQLLEGQIATDAVSSGYSTISDSSTNPESWRPSLSQKANNTSTNLPSQVLLTEETIQSYQTAKFQYTQDTAIANQKSELLNDARNALTDAEDKQWAAMQARITAEDQRDAAKAKWETERTPEAWEAWQDAEGELYAAIHEEEDAIELAKNARTAVESAEDEWIVAQTKQIDSEREFNRIKSEIEPLVKADAAAVAVNDMISRKVSSPSDIKDLIKIPDVYSLTLTFTSLLPDNFNNYLYGFRGENLDPIENYVKGNLNETGVFEQLVQQLEAVIGGAGG